MRIRRKCGAGNTKSNTAKGKTRYETRIIKEFASAENTYIEVIDGVAHTITSAVLPAAQRRDVNLTRQVLVRPGKHATNDAMRADCPRIKMPFIEPHDAAFYRAYANRNLSAEEMRAKFGQVEEDAIITLETGSSSTPCTWTCSYHRPSFRRP